MTFPFSFVRSWIACTLLGSLLVVSVGCEETAPAQKTTATKKPSAKPAPPQPKPVDPNAYASVDEAMAAVETGFVDPAKSKDIMVAQEWMQSKGSAIEAEVAAVLRDENAHLAKRIMACRVLSKLGAAAVPTLTELAKPGPQPDQLRQNAVECLGMVQPVDKGVIDQLVVFSADKNDKVRMAAMRGLAKIGPPVKDAHPEMVAKLQGVLNSQSEDDMLRNQAKATLKSIEPRHGFSGMGKAGE